MSTEPLADHAYVRCDVDHGDPETGEPGCADPRWCHYVNPLTNVADCDLPDDRHPAA